MAKQTIQKLGEKDMLFAKAFIEDPDEFVSVMKKDPDCSEVITQLITYYGPNNGAALAGGVALMASQYLRPTDSYIDKNLIGGNLHFKTESGNGSYIIYESTCPNIKLNFLKIALSRQSDFLEVESIALRVIKQLMPDNLSKYFQYYLCAGKILCTAKSPKVFHFPIKSYISGSIYTSKNDKQIPIPFIMSQAVPCGISLNNVISPWQYIFANNIQPFCMEPKLIASMKCFFKSDVYQKAVWQRSLLLDDRKAVCARICDKVQEFIIALVLGCSKLYMSHADMHMDNILFDSDNDNFVLIDLGRASMNLEHLDKKYGVKSSELITQECKKICMARIPKTDMKPNDVFGYFGNVNERSVSNLKMSKQMQKYNIFFDLAGTIYMFHRYMIILFPSIHMQSHVIKITGFAYSVFIKEHTQLQISIPSIKNLAGMISKLGYFDLCLTFFAIIAHAMHLRSKSYGVLTYVDTDGNLSMPEESIIPIADPSSEHKRIFYPWGQPNIVNLEPIINDISNICKQLDFFTHVKRVFKQQGAKLLAQKSQSLQGGSDTNTDFTICELTEYNYSNRV